MKIKFKYLAITLSIIILLECSKEKRITRIEPYLVSGCSYTQKIGAFYIVSSDQKPKTRKTTKGSTTKEIFDQSVQLFSNFLDEDGEVDMDNLELLDGLGDHMFIFLVI